MFGTRYVKFWASCTIPKGVRLEFPRNTKFEFSFEFSFEFYNSTRCRLEFSRNAKFEFEFSIFAKFDFFRILEFQRGPI